MLHSPSQKWTSVRKQQQKAVYSFSDFFPPWKDLLKLLRINIKFLPLIKMKDINDDNYFGRISLASYFTNTLLFIIFHHIFQVKKFIYPYYGNFCYVPTQYSFLCSFSLLFFFFFLIKNTDLVSGPNMLSFRTWITVVWNSHTT